MAIHHPLPSVSPLPVHDELIEMLADRAIADQSAVPAVAERGDALFVDLIWTLTNLRFSEAEARRHWEALLEHKYFLSERLGRDVRIHVAALDYFANILGQLVHPRIVDPVLLERLYAEALIDPLTGLPNRRHFRERLLGEIARSRRHGGVFTLGIYDFDNFKRLNDTSGHAAGDQALQKMARLLRSALRESDLVARWGGEEFIMLLPETGKRAAALLAERQRARIENEFASEKLTVSGGLSTFPHDGTTEETLFEFADRALYRAKGLGKNRVCLAPHERRAWPRLDETFQVRLAPVLRQGIDAQETRTRNIGAGGICVLYPQAITITTVVTGEITVGDRLIAFEGRVSRVEEINDDRYEIGIAFLDIGDDDRDLLLTLSNA